MIEQIYINRFLYLICVTIVVIIILALKDIYNKNKELKSYKIELDKSNCLTCKYSSLIDFNYIYCYKITDYIKDIVPNEVKCSFYNKQKNVDSLINIKEYEYCVKRYHDRINKQLKREKAIQEKELNRKVVLKDIFDK